jgi:hypothetical protein
MPRYFFDVHDGTSLPDSEGTELPDSRAMRGEAIRMAGQILDDLDGKFPGGVWVMNVRDDGGRVLMTLRFSVTEYEP